MPSSVLSLNDDIASHIFNILVDASHPTVWLGNWPKKDPKNQRVLQARRISQVCSSWRGVILGRPALWGRILYLSTGHSTKSLKWESEIIRRAPGSSLSIRAEFTYERKERVDSLADFLLNILEKDWSRMQNFSLIWKTLDEEGEGYPVRKFFDIMRRPAPSLLTVSLVLDSLNPPGIDASALFGGMAPILRNVHIGTLAVREDAFWLANLQTLHLEDGRDYSTYSDGFILKVTELFAILRKATTLQHLVISGTLQGNEGDREVDWDGEDVDEEPDTEPSWKIRYPSIALAHLRSLVINEDLLQCISILRTFQFDNPLSALSIYAGTDRRNDEDYDQVAGELMAEAISIVLPLFHRYSTLNKVNNLEISFGTYGHYLNFSSDHNDGRFDLTLHFESRTVVCDALQQGHYLQQVVEFDLRSLKRISFDDDGVFLYGTRTDREMLIRLFSCLPRVSHLATSVTCLKGILSLKADLAGALPSLQTLGLAQAEWDRVDSPSIIRDFLTWRLEQGYQIEHLEIGDLTNWPGFNGNPPKLSQDNLRELKSYLGVEDSVRVYTIPHVCSKCSPSKA